MMVAEVDNNKSDNNTGSNDRGASPLGHIHILGICGTFMGGIAAIAKSLGYRVTGSDAQVYPPMSTQLETLGIELKEGYDPAHLARDVDLVIVGNALSRGNPALEVVLKRQLPYLSGPQWLYEHVLKDRWVIAVAGTHGKTTTTSMVTWILHQAGLNPGYLIGGVPRGLPSSAALGEGSFFVIEADEYDSAFYDKRSKFVHYRPRTLLLNNLEFDHADIFENLDAIKRQFHVLVRTVPSDGHIIYSSQEPNLEAVLNMGCWTPTVKVGGVKLEGLKMDGQGGASQPQSQPQSQYQWQAADVQDAGASFEVQLGGLSQGRLEWSMLGQHNIQNALGAMACARHAGVTPEQSIKALSQFPGIKRRLEVKGRVKGVTVYDDFAHHPTAIRLTLEGLRKHVGNQRIFAILELGSYTMKTGYHRDQLSQSWLSADRALLLKPAGNDWGIADIIRSSHTPASLFESSDAIIDALIGEVKSGDHVLVMSNRGFDSLHDRLLDRLGE